MFCCCCVFFVVEVENSEFLSSVLVHDVQETPVHKYNGMEVIICPFKTMGSGTFQVLNPSSRTIQSALFSVNR